MKLTSDLFMLSVDLIRAILLFSLASLCFSRSSILACRRLSSSLIGKIMLHGTLLRAALGLPVAALLFSKSSLTYISKTYKYAIAAALASSLVYFAVQTHEPSVYERLGLSGLPSPDEVNYAYRQSAEQLHASHSPFRGDKEKLDKLYSLVRGKNGKAYAKTGDHMERTNSVVIEMWFVAAHAVAKALLFGSLTYILFGTLAPESSRMVAAYLFMVSCFELYVRLVEDSILLGTIQTHPLPFQVIQLVWSLFPAVAVMIAGVVDYLDFRSEQERLVTAVKRLLITNADLKNAILDPTSQPIAMKAAEHYEPITVGDVLGRLVGLALLAYGLIAH